MGLGKSERLFLTKQLRNIGSFAPCLTVKARLAYNNVTSVRKGMDNENA